jgi:hypothetical protein
LDTLSRSWKRREVKMQKTLRIAVVSAAVLAALLFLAPAPGEAQVRVEGNFRLPHGNIAIGVGDPYYRRGYPRVYYGSPAYPVGSYVPYGSRVIRRSNLGYGFYSPAFVCHVHGVRHSHWIPVRSYGRRYIVVERPIVVVDRRDGSYRGDAYYDFNREYWDRDYRNPYRQ